MEVGGRDVVRSGEFVAGNFRPYVNRPGEYDKIWWMPLHGAAGARGLEVEATPLDGPGKARSFSFSAVASHGNGTFYPSEVPLPKDRTWRLVATSGPDWDCFVVEMPSPQAGSVS